MNFLRPLSLLPFFSKKNIKSTNESPWIVDDSDMLDLEIKKTTLPIKTLSKGLFAKRDFEAKEILGEYRGPIIKGETYDDSVFGFEDKMVDLNEEYILIGQSVVAFANDCIDLQLEKFETAEYKEWIDSRQFPKHKDCVYNSEFQFKANKVFLVSTRKIHKGDEIFLSYGFDYWKAYFEH